MSIFAVPGVVFQFIPHDQLTFPEMSEILSTRFLLLDGFPLGKTTFIEQEAPTVVAMLTWALSFCLTGEVMETMLIKPCPVSWGGDDGVGVGAGIIERAGDGDGLMGGSVRDGVLVEVWIGVGVDVCPAAELFCGTGVGVGIGVRILVGKGVAETTAFISPSFSTSIIWA